MINSPIVFADKNYIYLQKISVKVVKLDDLQNEGKILSQKRNATHLCQYQNA